MKTTKIQIYILLSCMLFSFGCSQDGTVSNLSPEIPAIESSEVNTCSSPTTSVIWKGERPFANTAALRGVWSDVKTIPDTTYQAIVYTDVGCACIKYTFWNGTDWSTEVISAGSTTSFTHLRLAFLSNGVPIVVWSNSLTRLQMAIRNTNDLSVQGQWSLSNLDSLGTVIRAVEIKINPDDQVAIAYARNTAGSSHIILCAASCEVGSNYSLPSVSLGNVGTNPNTLGLGWCNSGTSYYPVVALTGSANSTYGICRQGNILDCLTGIASWAGGALQTFTGSGANRATIQLAIDDSSVDAPIRGVAHIGTGLAHYQSSFVGGGCATGTIGAIPSGGTIAGTAANSGNGYIELTRVSGNNYHLIANETTTSVRYYNTTSGTFTMWNGAGTVATLTLGTAGATRGGLAVDSTLGHAYTTYARTAAATPFNGNLIFAQVEDSTIASNSTSAEFYENPLTIDGQLQMTASQVPNVSVAATSAGVPATAFVDYSTNSATVGVLRYGLRSGNLATDSWNIRNVPIVAQPQSVSLIFDANDKPWIAFYDQLTLRFRLVTNTRTDGTGVWSVYYFPFRTVVTAATAPAFHGVALAMDLTASGVTPVMIVGVANHATVANTGVWTARLNPETGAWANLTQLESTNAANSNSNVTADFDVSGTIVVAYYDRSAAHNRVEYVQSLNGGVAWSSPTNVTNLTAMGMGARIKINPSNSRPAMTYYDRANNRVYYSYCTSSISTCTNLTNWSYNYAENLTAGVSGLAATSDGLMSTGLTFTGTGIAYTVYPIGSGNSGVLALNNNSSGSFSLSSTLVAGANTNVTLNPAMSAINFAQPGWSVDAVRTSLGSMHSVYVGAGNWLYATSCGD